MNDAPSIRACFDGQWSDGVKQIVVGSNDKLVPISANMTRIFQALDLIVNRGSKAFLRSHVQDWYSNDSWRRE